jgi:hypothetical protein
MEAIFGYYFGAIILFSILSGIVSFIYSQLTEDDTAARYPDEYKEWLNYMSSHPWMSRHKAWLELLRIIKTLGDDKLNNMVRKGSFWSNCAVSILVTAPLGIVIFLILKARQ